MLRDFTYIADIVEGVLRLSCLSPDSANEAVTHDIYNIGNNHPIELERFIAAIETATGKTAQRVLLPMPTPKSSNQKLITNLTSKLKAASKPLLSGIMAIMPFRSS